MEGIQVSVERAGASSNIAVIKVGGYIDTTTSAELEHSLDSLLKASSYKIIVDLGSVDYISSAGWGIFISEIKGIRERGGDLKLVKMIPDVYEVFELLEFHYIIKAFDTLEEAVNDFEKNGSASSSSPARPRPAQSDRMQSGSQTVPARETETEEAPYQSAHTNALTLNDYIVRAATENPTVGTFKLKKLLRSPQYGGSKVGFFELRRKLKTLNLDSPEKRMQGLSSRT